MLSISRPRTLDLEVHKEKMQQRRQELARSAEANFLIDTLLRNPKRDRRKLKELFYSQASLLEAALEQLSEQEIETLLESGKRLEDALCDLLAELEKVPELGEDKSLALDVVHEMLCGAQQYSGTAASNDVELNPDKFETGALIVDDCVQNSELATQRKVILAEKAERVLEEVVTQRIINSPNVVDDASSKNKRRLAPKNIIFHLKSLKNLLLPASSAKSDDGSEISTTDQKVLATVFLQLEQSAAVSQSTGKIPNAIKLAHAINLIDSVLARLVLDPKTAKEVQSSLAALKKLIR